MRDLDLSELGHVYGASGKSCSPMPPSCSTKGSKNKLSKNKMSKGKNSRGKGSKSHGRCYS